MTDPRVDDQLLQRYLDDLLDETELTALDRRLAQEPELAARLASLSRLEVGLASYFAQQSTETSQDPSPVRQPAAPERHERPWRRFLAAAAVLLVATGVVLTLLLTRTSPEPATDKELHVVLSGQVTDAGSQRTQLAAGREIVVVGESDAVIQLADQSIASLRPSSRAVLHGSVGDLRQRVELVEGVGTFSVEKGAGRFQVDTPVGQVTALGTVFTVRLSGNRERYVDVGDGEINLDDVAATAVEPVLAVGVLSGRVRVSIRDNMYELGAGESRVYIGDGRGDRGQRIGRREHRGTLKEIGADHITVHTGGDRARDARFNLARDIRVVIDDEVAAVHALRADMVVFVQRLDDDESLATGIRAEGPTVRGVVESVDSGARTITLAGRRRENGTTTKGATYALAARLRIEVNGQSATLADVVPGTNVTIRLATDGNSVLNITVGSRKGEAERGS